MCSINIPFARAPLYAAGALLLAVSLLAGGCASKDETRRAPANGLRDSAFDDNANRPPTGETLHALARILSAQGRDDESSQVLERIVHQEPQFMPAYCDLAEIYVRRNQLEEATEILNLGLSRKPEDSVLLNNLGMCWFLQEDYERAAMCFDRAVQAKPNDPTYLGNKAAALALLGQYSEATDAYRQVLRRDPDAVLHNLLILSTARNQRLGMPSNPSTTQPVPATQASGIDLAATPASAR